MRSWLRSGVIVAATALTGLATTACDGGGSAPPPPPLVETVPPGPAAGSSFDIPSGIDGVPPVKVTVVTAGNRGKPIIGNMVDYHMISKAQGREPYIDSRATGKPRDKRAGVPQTQPGMELMFDRMQVGDRWTGVIPAPLGYGQNGGAAVPANSTLEVDIEILGVRKP